MVTLVLFNSFYASMVIQVSAVSKLFNVYLIDLFRKLIAVRDQNGALVGEGNYLLQQFLTISRIFVRIYNIYIFLTKNCQF
jgi:hypothetical protein